MINLEYHKGTFCSYSSMFCQEGYCIECHIYLRNRLSIKTEGYQIKTSEDRKLRNTVIASAHS